MAPIDSFERLYAGRELAPEYPGVTEDDLDRLASERGVHDIRVVVRDGWFAWSPEVVGDRLSVIVNRRWAGPASLVGLAPEHQRL